MKTIQALKAQGKVALWLDWRAGVETDQSGNNLTVNYTGPIVQAKTKYGNGIYIGASQIVEVVNNAAINTAGYTVIVLGEFTPRTNSRLLSMRDGSASRWEIFYSVTTALQINVNNTGGSYPIPDNRAYMYGARINTSGETADMFKNGSFSGNSTTAAMPVGTPNLYIGSFYLLVSDANSHDVFSQAIIFNSALTDQEITDIYQEYILNSYQDTGRQLFKYAKPYLADKTNVLFETGFEIRQDGKVNDVSNNGRHGTYAGPVKNVTGLIGNESSNVFDENASISIGTVTATSQDLIFEWIGRHPTANTNFEYLIYTANKIVCHGSSTAQLAWFESSTFRNFGVAPVDNNLHHYMLTLTATDGKARLYVDGTQLGTDQTYTPFTLNEAVWLKDNNLAGGDYQGLISYLRISQGTTTTVAIQARANLVRYLISESEDLTKLPATNTLTSGSISDWSILSGTWKLNTSSQLQNSAIGNVSRPSTFSGGTFVFEFRKTDNGNDSTISYIATQSGGYGAGRGNGYVLQLSANENIALYSYIGAAPTLLLSTANSIFANNTDYKIAIKYQPGVDTIIYIKGGVYATWTLILGPVTTTTVFGSGFLGVNCALAGGFNFRHLYNFNGLLSATDLDNLNI